MAEPLTDAALAEARQQYADRDLAFLEHVPAMFAEIDRLRADAFVAVVRQRDAAEAEAGRLRVEVAELRRAVADAEDGGEEVS